ncbi:MAG: hypothetical protein DRR19_11430 [Candidatus Parabeggiatoa sp. nov. 1]|nr:MAG: hypothetical protein DRR19_11430 [Gammaproteobacteria bacterium]
MVADSAWDKAKTLVEMNDFFWISRVPESLSSAQELIAAIAPYLMETPEKMTWRTQPSNYASVHQRWLVIFSLNAYQRGLKSINKHCLKLRQANLKAFEKLCRQDFVRYAEALQSLSQFENTLNLTCSKKAVLWKFHIILERVVRLKNSCLIK